MCDKIILFFILYNLFCIPVKSKLETEKSRDWFLEDAVYGTDESKRLEKLKLSSDVFGAEGSFRKLNLD